MNTAVTSGSGAVQGPLWSAAAEDWANIQEPQSRALSESVIAHGAFKKGARVLDVGCGAGRFAAMLHARGCEVTGFDAAESLVAIARRRTPTARFDVGDMEALPYADHGFDIITGINSFQYAANPGRALSEARRVARRGAEIFVATWGLPDRSEATVYLGALKAMLPAPPPGAPGPFALSDEAALRDFVKSAGLTAHEVVDVDVIWEYPDLSTALAGLLSAGPAIRAIQHSGRDRVRQAVTESLAPFRQSSGRYRLENSFRYLRATA